MNLTQIITAFVSSFVSSIIGSELPLLEAKLPGILRTLVDDALKSDIVLKKIAQWEAQGVSALIHLAEGGLDELKALVLGHVKGKLGEAIQAGVVAAGGALSLNADQVKKLEVIALAGKLDEAIAAELTKLGLAA